MIKEGLQILYKKFEKANEEYKNFRDKFFTEIQNGRVTKPATDILDIKNLEILERLSKKRDELLDKWKDKMHKLYPDF